MTHDAAGKYTGPGSPTHGIASTYRNASYKCRCGPCTAANTAYQRQDNAQRKAKLEQSRDQFKHGRSGYVNWSCRCDVCCAAHQQEMVQNRQSRYARLAADPSIRPHGTEATYSGWGCRCDDCKAAVAQAKRRRSA